MFENLADNLRGITVYLAMIYPLLYIIGFTKNSKAYKIFTIYLVIIGLVQLSMQVHGNIFKGESNLFFFIYYFVLQFIALSFFYKELLEYKWLHIVTGIVLSIIGYQYFLDPSMYFRYNPIGSSLTQIIIVIYSLLYFYKSLSGKREFLIVNVGMFFYMLSSLLIFASGNLVFNDNIPGYIPKLLTNVNIVLYFIFQILIVVEWYRNYRRT